jgi:class 3 adenylate cyclase
VEVPDVHYTRGGEVSIAYQVVGRGPVDLVFVPFLGNLISPWEEPRWRAFYERLASFSRLILLDKRGTGLSDRPRGAPTLEAQMDDVRAVLDAVGSERAVLVGAHQGGQMCALFAATYPERTAALVLYNTVSRSDLSQDERAAHLREIRECWGERAFLDGMAALNPSVDSEPYRAWFATFQRLAVSPSSAGAFWRMWYETDICDVLPAIRVPTLVLGRQELEAAREIAGLIPGAQLVEAAGDDFAIWANDDAAREIERFLSGTAPAVVPDRVLATVLFTDIVGSTRLSAELGDARWRDLLSAHQGATRRELARFRGVEIDAVGDGFFASFDGPARAIACALELVERARALDVELRAGLHTGECELVNGKIAGLVVHIGARVAAIAEPGQVLVSSTVRDLVAGSGIEFEEAGEHELKGVPGTWPLFTVNTPNAAG